MSTTDTSREAFEAWHKKEFGYVDLGYSACDEAESRWCAWQAATEAAKATGAAGELPPEWISEVCGPDVNDLSYGQGYRRGFNDCRKKVAELQDEAARQPAPVAKPFGWVQFIDGEQTQNFARDEKELATVKAITSTMPGLKNVEYVPVFAALAATAAPVLSDEQILDIRNRVWQDVKADDEYDSSDIFFARAILAATRSQP